MKTLLSLSVVLFLSFFTIQNATAQADKLDFFRVEAENCDLKLVFGANSLMNYTQFIIEKSRDGRRYYEIAAIQPRNWEAAPAIGASIRYEYTDREPFYTNYYRIKVMKGRGDYFNTRTIKVNSPCIIDDSSIVLGPNPTNLSRNSVSVGMEWPSSVCTVEMLDITGRKVKEWKLSNLHDAVKRDLDLSGVIEGVYFITVKNRPEFKPTKLMVLN